MRLTMALLACLLLPTLAAAEKPDKGGKHGEAAAVFAAPEKDTARGYFVETHGRGNCPPGLAKKHNGCLPPGQAKKRYVVGRPLPRGIVVEELPAELSVRIGSAPAGYRYGILDGDLVKLAAGT